MQISTEIFIALVSSIVVAQSTAIVWLTKQMIACYISRLDAQEKALELARRGKDQTERAVRAAKDLT